MSREVKFRAKVLNTNNWIYRQPFHIRGTWYMYNQLWDMVPIEHKTIGQYTGLKDKNGVEIYEGDVVNRIESTGYTFVGEVLYEEYGFGIKPHGFFRPLSKNGKYDDGKSSFDFSMEYEIIGNIYEHPHLLEVSQ